MSRWSPAIITVGTPPCSEALLGAGIVRVVTALWEDPDPRVSGGGHERLREGGITVVSDVLRRKAEDVNAGFLRRVRDGRPLVTLKVASTLDGKIASGTGESKWITGPEARARGHLLRANHDAIMIGIGTALADDPELTCRLGGLSDHSPDTDRCGQPSQAGARLGTGQDGKCDANLGGHLA